VDAQAARVRVAAAGSGAFGAGGRGADARRHLYSDRAPRPDAAVACEVERDHDLARTLGGPSDAGDAQGRALGHQRVAEQHADTHAELRALIVAGLEAK